MKLEGWVNIEKIHISQSQLKHSWLFHVVASHRCIKHRLSHNETTLNVRVVQTELIAEWKFLKNNLFLKETLSSDVLPLIVCRYWDLNLDSWGRELFTQVFNSQVVLLQTQTNPRLNTEPKNPCWLQTKHQYFLADTPILFHFLICI